MPKGLVMTVLLPLSHLPSVSVFPVGFQGKLSENDQALNQIINRIITSLLKERYQDGIAGSTTEGFEAATLLPNPMRDDIFTCLNYPRSSVERAIIIKIFATPYFENPGAHHWLDTSLKELSFFSKIASSFEGAHRGMDVECPMLFAEALSSGRVIHTKNLGQKELMIFNGLKFSQITALLDPNYNPQGHNTPFLHRYNNSTHVSLDRGFVCQLTSDIEFGFFGNARRNTLGKVLKVEIFKTSDQQTFHSSNNGHGTWSSVPVYKGFNIRLNFFGPESPIRGWSWDYYDLLHSNIRFYGKGQLVAIDLSKVLEKNLQEGYEILSNIFVRTIIQYLKATQSRGLVLFRVMKKYHFVHLLDKFEWDKPLNFLTSKVNNCWWNWQYPLAPPTTAGSGGSAKKEVEKRSAYVSLGLMNSLPNFITSNECQIILRREGEAHIMWSRNPDQTQKIKPLAVFKAHKAIQPTPLPKYVIDSANTFLREIISGCKRIEDPLEERYASIRRARVYLVEPSLYLGYGYGASRLMKGENIVAITQQGVKFVENTIKAESVFGEFSASSQIDLIGRRDLGELRFEAISAYLINARGQRTLLARVIDRPLYPDLSVMHINRLLETFKIEVEEVRDLICEYSRLNSEYIDTNIKPPALQQFNNPVNVYDEELVREWTGDKHRKFEPVHAISAS